MWGVDGCSHGCNNTEGAYYCTCPVGYELSDDSRTCVGEYYTSVTLYNFIV